jgi:2-polyprenyl-3-methyl-5-hydroxy-6-metoxy-1,4-benzoquinol methylase
LSVPIPETTLIPQREALGDPAVACQEVAEGVVERLKAVWSAYRRCSAWTRLHVLGRYLACPSEVLVPWFPKEGDVLDVGCGHGLLAWLLERDDAQATRRYLGIDHDAGKIAAARMLPLERATFSTETLANLASERYDCVSLVDVLYAIPLSNWAEVLRHCARVLRKGGRLVVKEVANEPRWKYWLACLEEALAIQVFKVTKGCPPHFESFDVYRRHVESSGFEVLDVRRLDAWRPHAHCALLARKIVP